MSDAMMLTSVNPHTGETIASHSAIHGAALDALVDEVADAAESWRACPLRDRLDLLRSLESQLIARKAELAEQASREMGKTIAGARSEVEKCAWACRYYAKHAPAFLADIPVATDARESYVSFLPLGALLAVMPWNFPYWQLFRFAAPAIAAGNTVVLKHASNVPGCALAIEKLFRDAGFPEGVLRNAPTPSGQVERVLAHPRLRGVTLTGSTAAGRSLAAAAGRHVKKTVLELGGSDAYLVLEDADLERTAEACAASRLINNGQSCIAAKRFIVMAPLYEAFIEAITARFAAVKAGDPLDESVDLGPLARADLRDTLAQQVAESRERGARCTIGGEVPQGRGFHYPPTVLADVAPGMPAYEDELFGPVAAVMRAADEAGAVRIANDSPYGLGAAVFTEDEQRGERIARDCLEAGSCFVNDFVKSDPRLPFGGIKDSGYGRELGLFGMREFVNLKTVYIA